MISKDVVILTKAELAEIRREAFLRGVDRGKFEANSSPPGKVGHPAGAVESHESQDTVPAGRPT
jgi:hypothetical protein